MNDLSALRFYLYYYQRVKSVKRKTFWQQLTTPSSLAHYLAYRAKEFGIRQVVVYQVSAGFLEGDSLTHDNSEFPPTKLPQCVELIDYEGMLRLFIEENRYELKNVKIALFRCQELYPDWLWLDEIKECTG